MLKKICNRLLFSLVILLALTFFVFSLSSLIKGNVIDTLLGEESASLSQDAYDALIHEMGLDQPVPVRYLRWLTNFLRGDMGVSIQQNRTVADLLSQRIGPTLLLSSSALLISILISIPLGVMSAYKPYSFWDNLSSAVAFLSSSMPGFMICLFAIYIFSVKLGIFPTYGMYYSNQPHTLGNLLIRLALPALISGVQMTGGLIKQTRGAVLEVMNEEYIKTARSKGLKETAVVVKHGLRNALIPIITQISLSLPFLVGGSVVMEQIFSWPGMGSLIISSIYARDYEPVLGCCVVICTVALIGNILVDFVYMLVDPRLSREK